MGLTLKGNTQGFAALVKRYRREAYFHAYGFLGDSDDASDACQEAFSRAFRTLPNVKKLNAFYPWFYTILKNYCISYIRKNRRFQPVAPHTLDDTLKSSSKNSDEQLIEKEEKKILRELLASLPEESREILTLKYILNYDYKAIASLLSIPRGTVMSRLYYARKKIAEKIEKNSIFGTTTGRSYDDM